ncbi:MAG: hypothetical protein DI562_03225 [Stenotrophomonas acidaminiphila]|nr:MAG: hypothetical protein DI562_03225 [Stenotrophomonas acidaminiphila]
MRKGILVLGMHRSGTSALTGALQRLGVELGDDLLPANKDNVRGFWESRAAMEIDEALLSKLSSRWDAVTELPEHWLDSPAARDGYGKAVSLLDSSFAAAALWAIKDPRMCRLAPLWLKAMHTVGVEPAVVMIVRKPSEVVASLGERDGIPCGLASLLWLRHVLEAERHSRDVPRVIVTYDQLLSDSRAVFDRISVALDVAWPRSDQEAEADIESFLAREEKHHNHIEGSLGLELVDDAYALCCQLAEGTGAVDWSGFDRITHEFNAAWRVLGEPLADMYAAAENALSSRQAERGEWERRKREDLEFFQSHIEKLNEENRALGSRLLEAVDVGAQREADAARRDASLAAVSEGLIRLQEAAAESQRLMDARLSVLRADSDQANTRLRAQEERTQGLDSALRAFVEHANAGSAAHEGELRRLAASVGQSTDRLDRLTELTERLEGLVADQEQRMRSRGWIVRGLLGMSGKDSESGDGK